MFDNVVTRDGPGHNSETVNEVFSDLYVENRVGKIHEYPQDFDQYIAADYTVTLGGGAAALAAGDGGILSLVTAVSAATLIQKTPANYQLVKAFRAWVHFRAQIDNILGAVVHGLINATAAPFTPANVTDGLYMLTDGTGAVSFAVAVGGVRTIVAAGVSLVAAAQYSFSAYYDGGCYAAAPNGRVVFQITGAGVSANNRTVIVLPAGTTFPGAVNLAPVSGVNATTAAARTMLLDLMYVAKDRTNINATPNY